MVGFFRGVIGHAGVTKQQRRKQGGFINSIMRGLSKGAAHLVDPGNYKKDLEKQLDKTHNEVHRKMYRR